MSTHEQVETLKTHPTSLSIVIPCYNEEETIRICVDRVLKIASDELALELIIVDDCSRDHSFTIATELANSHSNIRVLKHDVNQGKGAALRTGFAHATGDFVAVQDADLEYDPNDLIRLIEPLKKDYADVVMGSRFLSPGAHRALYYWHSLGNHCLTTLSNMLTDLNLTDMETCYKVFKREIIQSIPICENRFGFEPEITAKIAQRRLRVYEIGISYYGRTYAQGKKIGLKDAFRAVYCIMKYNLPTAPFLPQFVIYSFVGGIAALFNLMIFVLLNKAGTPLLYATTTAFFLAAALNYVLSISILFRHKAKWNSVLEIVVFCLVVSTVCIVDYFSTKTLIASGLGIAAAKLLSSGIGLILNFIGRKYLIFYEKQVPPWSE
jgi:glycosyltransferase involved in cell wall biosynthesis